MRAWLSSDTAGPESAGADDLFTVDCEDFKSHKAVPPISPRVKIDRHNFPGTCRQPIAQSLAGHDFFVARLLDVSKAYVLSLRIGRHVTIRRARPRHSFLYGNVTGVWPSAAGDRRKCEKKQK
jgi:hypothetical protein